MGFRKIMIVAIAVLLLLSLGGCFFPGAVTTTSGNGQMTDGSFSYDGSITKIIVYGVPATVNIRPESSSELTYTIDDNLQDLLEITYQNGVLRIGTRNRASITSNRISFEIGADSLEEIVVDGAATIQGSGTFSAASFALEINGAGSAELALNAQRVSAEINGAGDITLSGAAEDLHITGAGAVDINTRNLIAQHATISLEGVGSAQIHAEQTLDASVEGVGSITYWGDPELTSSAAGLASVRRGG